MNFDSSESEIEQDENMQHNKLPGDNENRMEQYIQGPVPIEEIRRLQNDLKGKTPILLIIFI